MDTTFIVTKLISGTVFYIIPGEVRERTWVGPNAKQRVPFEELEKCVFDPRTKSLFTRGFLYIEDKDCRIKLELEQPDPTLQNEEKLILERKDLVNLLYVSDFGAFKEKVEKLSEGSVEGLIEISVNTPKQLTIEKAEYIRDNFHVDVETIQRQKRQDEKEAKKEG